MIKVKKYIRKHPGYEAFQVKLDTIANEKEWPEWLSSRYSYSHVMTINDDIPIVSMLRKNLSDSPNEASFVKENHWLTYNGEEIGYFSDLEFKKLFEEDKTCKN